MTGVERLRGVTGGKGFIWALRLSNFSGVVSCSGFDGLARLPGFIWYKRFTRVSRVSKVGLKGLHV